MKNNRNDNISTNEPIRYIPAPYIKATTERVNKILRPYNIRLGSKPTNTLKSKLCILKDKINDEDKTNCVYQISCGECPAQYIGQTSRELKTRVKEHQRAVATFDPNSLIYQHLQETDHFFNWNSSKFIQSNPNNECRRILESIYSVKIIIDNSINRKEHLPNEYIPLLKDNN